MTSDKINFKQEIDNCYKNVFKQESESNNKNVKKNNILNSMKSYLGFKNKKALSQNECSYTISNNKDNQNHKLEKSNSEMIDKNENVIKDDIVNLDQLSNKSLDNNDKIKVPIFSNKIKDKFKNILIHIHGGGFVAMSSSYHQTYLREISNKLNLPIFSIDYRLAPAFKYPTGLLDCILGTLWILVNLKEIC